jgi:hypothetical protein
MWRRPRGLVMTSAPFPADPAGAFVEFRSSRKP